MKYSHLLLLSTILGTFVLLSSCKNVVGPSSGTQIIFPNSNVSYTKQVQPLFDQDCSYYGCHDDQTAAGNVDLTSYTNLFSGQVGVVIPKDTVSSILIQVVEGKGYIMPPPPVPKLNSNQIHGLKIWIMEGAQFN